MGFESHITTSAYAYIIPTSFDYFIMNHWFARNSYMGSIVNVINYEHIIFKNFFDFGTQ
jgi:alpha-1,4-galacturonosyltransferase